MTSIVPATVNEARADEVVDALSGYHETKTAAQLEQLAGGREALITKLLEIRHQETPPFVGVRAAKLLLGYADDPRVADALAADMGSYLGLAKVITTNVDSVNHAPARERLAKLALERASRESKFVPYAKSLTQSKDAAVSKLAKEQLN